MDDNFKPNDSIMVCKFFAMGIITIMTFFGTSIGVMYSVTSGYFQKSTGNRTAEWSHAFNNETSFYISQLLGASFVALVLLAIVTGIIIAIQEDDKKKHDVIRKELHKRYLIESHSELIMKNDKKIVSKKLLTSNI
ncbi:hypothetical protein [Companilactobacillus sp. FL22-1]|uniref:hypothetical protein n=1 Tax=Companilactobacillus sp. FL22-1 TaxID=3373892 RepID=UPI003754F335